jgi:hypothetical protein
MNWEEINDEDSLRAPGVWPRAGAVAAVAVRSIVLFGLAINAIMLTSCGRAISDDRARAQPDDHEVARTDDPGSPGADEGADPEGPVLGFAPREWASFVAKIKRGTLDSIDALP